MPQMTVDFGTYTDDALRSETPLGTIVTDPQALKAALKTAVAASEFVDLVKKGVIYGKSIDADTLVKAVDKIHAACDGFEEAIWRDVPEDYEGEMVEVNPRLLHSALGKFGESGEILEHLLHELEGKGLDLVGVCEEFGDDKWYDAVGLDEIAKRGGDPLPVILMKNIAKLKARYPDKFSLEASENRDTEAERAILEGGA